MRYVIGSIYLCSHCNLVTDIPDSRYEEVDILKKNIENASHQNANFVIFCHNYPQGTPYEVM